MNDETAKVLTVLFLFMLLVVLVTVGPFFTAWSVNYLFGTKIVMNFKTWCAVIWLMTVFRGINISIKKN